jgi:AraC-like DNA-binding protein
MPRRLKNADWFHPDGFPIAVEWRNPQEPYGLHGHEFAELVIITAGHGLHVTGRERWPLAAGDVFVISGRRLHAYQNLDNLQLVNLMFRPHQLKMELLDLSSLPGYHALFVIEPAAHKDHPFRSRLHLSPQELGIVMGLVDQLDRELKSRARGFGLMAKVLFLQIMVQISRCHDRQDAIDSRALQRIAESLSHLEIHFASPALLDELAHQAGMSKRSFLRAFRAATGRTPIDYLIQLRINRAATLLRNSQDPITEIAFRAGFNDSNYFSRQFRKLTGVSPRAYRHQHLQLG